MNIMMIVLLDCINYCGMGCVVVVGGLFCSLFVINGTGTASCVSRSMQRLIIVVVVVVVVFCVVLCFFFKYSKMYEEFKSEPLHM